MTTSPRTVLRTLSLSLGLALLLLLGFGHVSVRAQGGPGQIDSNPLAAISEQLARIIAAVSPSGPKTLHTGVAWIDDNVGVWSGCTGTNVGTAPITFQAKKINSQGSVVLTVGSTIQPGITQGSASTGAGVFRCEFTVSDAASFRGTLVVHENGGPATVSLEAR